MNGSGGSDAERQGEDRCERVDPMLGELPESKGNVLEQREHDASIFRADRLVTKITGNWTADSTRSKRGKIRSEFRQGIEEVSEDEFRRSDTDSFYVSFIGQCLNNVLLYCFPCGENSSQQSSCNRNAYGYWPPSVYRFLCQACWNGVHHEPFGSVRRYNS